MDDRSSETPIGARDALVFRRVSRTTWAHLGGLGAGARWAGTIELGAAEGPFQELQALGREGSRPVRHHGLVPHRVVGEYWAATSAVVRVDREHLVVLGDVEPSAGLHGAADEEVVDVAADVAKHVTAVAPARYLADELAVLTALAELTAAAPTTLPEVLHHVAATVARALGSELAVLWLPGGRFAVVQRGWSVPGEVSRLAPVVRGLVERLTTTGRDPWLSVPDAALDPLPAPLRPADGVEAYLALPVDVRAGRGVLLLAWTSGATAAEQAAPPRELSRLRQRAAWQLVRGSAPLVDVATDHDELRSQLDLTRADATSDPLTGARNRRGWDEALEAAREVVVGGHPVTVVFVDLDGLKQVNDSGGHAAGDELIVSAATALRECVRDEQDVVARVGGDEFALALPGVGAAPGVIAARLRRALEGVTTPSGRRLRTSVGAATCPPHGSLEDAVLEADAAMYADKRARRRPPGQAAPPAPRLATGGPGTAPAGP